MVPASIREGHTPRIFFIRFRIIKSLRMQTLLSSSSSDRNMEWFYLILTEARELDLIHGCKRFTKAASAAGSVIDQRAQSRVRGWQVHSNLVIRRHLNLKNDRNLNWINQKAKICCPPNQKQMQILKHQTTSNNHSKNSWKRIKNIWNQANNENRRF